MFQPLKLFSGLLGLSHLVCIGAFRDLDLEAYAELFGGIVGCDDKTGYCQGQWLAW